MVVDYRGIFAGFEVFSDNIAEMKEQALKINSWGKNIYLFTVYYNILECWTLPMGLPNAIRGGDIQEPHNSHGRA